MRQVVFKGLAHASWVCRCVVGRRQWRMLSTSTPPQFKSWGWMPRVVLSYFGVDGMRPVIKFGHWNEVHTIEPVNNIEFHYVVGLQALQFISMEYSQYFLNSEAHRKLSITHVVSGTLLYYLFLFVFFCISEWCIRKRTKMGIKNNRRFRPSGGYWVSSVPQDVISFCIFNQSHR